MPLDWIPWDQVWHGIEGLGGAAVVARGSYAIFLRTGGRRKYYQAIWSALDDAPGAMTKDDVREEVRRRLNPPKILNPFYKRKEGLATKPRGGLSADSGQGLALGPHERESVRPDAKERR